MRILGELGGVARLEWQRVRGSPRVIVLALLYVLSCLLLILVFGTTVRLLQEQFRSSLENPEAAQALAGRLREGLLGLLLGRTDPEAIKPLLQVPLIVFIGFRASLFFVPVWVALLGFDSVSDELGTRSIRYLTLRAQRSSLVVGKFLTLSAVLTVLLLLLNTGLLVYARVGNPEFTGGLWVMTLLRCWLAGSLFAMGYLGLTLLCSTLVTSSALALILNAAALYGFWAINARAESARLLRSMGVEDAPNGFWEYLRFASPSHYGPSLLDPEAARALPGAAAFLAFIILFIGAACAVLEARDV